MSISVLLIVAAVVCFVLAVASISVGVPLVPLGLAFFAAAHLPLP